MGSLDEIFKDKFNAKGNLVSLEKTLSKPEITSKPDSSGKLDVHGKPGIKGKPDGQGKPQGRGKPDGPKQVTETAIQDRFQTHKLIIKISSGFLFCT